MRSVIKLADATGIGADRRPAVRHRPADPRRRAGADHRARDRHPQPREGRGRGAAQGGDPRAARRAPRRPAGDAQAHAARDRRLLRRPGRPPARSLRVVALSGGYSRDEANARLARNPGVIASFSRALTEGLSAQQSDDEFDAMLDEAIASIYQASFT